MMCVFFVFWTIQKIFLVKVHGCFWRVTCVLFYPLWQHILSIEIIPDKTTLVWTFRNTHIFLLDRSWEDHLPNGLIDKKHTISITYHIEYYPSSLLKNNFKKKANNRNLSYLFVFRLQIYLHKPDKHFNPKLIWHMLSLLQVWLKESWFLHLLANTSKYCKYWHWQILPLQNVICVSIWHVDVLTHDWLYDKAGWHAVPFQ